MPVRALSLACALLGLIALNTGCDRAELLTPDRHALVEATDAIARTGERHESGASFDLPGSMYPLEIGNRWRYARTFAVDVVPARTPDRPPPIVIRARIERTLIGVERLFGRTYVVEEAVIEEGGSPPFYEWTRFRQDRAGLFSADVSIVQPPQLESSGTSARWSVTSFEGDAMSRALEGPLSGETDIGRQEALRRSWDRVRAQVLDVREALRLAPRTELHSPPGGIQPDEITRLLYPLRLGSTWFIREDPPFQSVVEGVEVLDLPAGRFPAYRIRIIPPGTGPEDKILVWYGRSGYLRLFLHVEDVATDDTGNPIGTVIAEDNEILDELALVLR